ncbi:MAG: N-acetyltransferase [Prevotellaceae bacterium]|nr:N-acetyltransferase [Prevotellaceae bacterium]
MTINHNPSACFCETFIEAKRCVVEYQMDGTTMRITHTFVPYELRGRGVAAALITYLLEYASTNSLHVQPLCAYAKGFMERHPQYNTLRV